MAAILSFAVRLFSVINFESIIHEFDPYFNYRTTRYLTEKGFYEFHNWFDDKAWYPLGRIVGEVVLFGDMASRRQLHLACLTYTVLLAGAPAGLAAKLRLQDEGGRRQRAARALQLVLPPHRTHAATGTIYPGLMVTSATLYKIMHILNITIDIRNVCVFLAPFFSSLTTIITYLLTTELKDEGAGLVAAAMIATVPGYISRSVAGSYDNEGIAIFCMLLTYYFWIKSVNTGAIFWGTMCALAYFYMVSSWGGYVFLINLIPLHVLLLMLAGRFSARIYVAYSTLYCVGTIMSMQIPFVGFQPIYTSEHMLALCTFGLCQLYAFTQYLRENLTPADFQLMFKALFSTLLATSGIGMVVLTVTGNIAPWTGRFYSLLDPSYAKTHIPIIASVSEHQPTAWASFYLDLHVMMLLFPAGLHFCFAELTDANIFIILYGILSIYFAGVMVRLMLVIAPAMCIVSGIAVSRLLGRYVKYIGVKYDKKKKLKDESNLLFCSEVGTLILVVLGCFLSAYVFHCTWVTKTSYSSPSIVLAAYTHDGSKLIFDDYREAYTWLKMNTHKDAKIMSWWDYGYQITAMANRTVIVDNNTWNNTHISLVAQAMASTEEKAYEIIREFDANYVLVVFGGLIKYPSDDINKFIWMVRIAGSTGRGAHIRENDYYSTKTGKYSVDADGSPTFLNCLMYKLIYYKFGNLRTVNRLPTGYDRVREEVIGNKDFNLDLLEEAYTTEHWLIRIYKVKPLPNRGGQ